MTLQLGSTLQAESRKTKSRGLKDCSCIKMAQRRLEQVAIGCLGLKPMAGDCIFPNFDSGLSSCSHFCGPGLLQGDLIAHKGHRADGKMPLPGTVFAARFAFFAKKKNDLCVSRKRVNSQTPRSCCFLLPMPIPMSSRFPLLPWPGYLLQPA